jgi:hypothetical protein
MEDNPEFSCGIGDADVAGSFVDTGWFMGRE